MVRNKFIKLIIMLLLVGFVFPQEWHILDSEFSQPGTYNLSCGAFVNENYGWVAEYFPGRIWKSINGGETWDLLIDSSSVWTHDLVFYNNNYGWTLCEEIGEDSTFMRKTINGGETWETKLLPQSVYKFWFNDSLRGFVVGRDSIYQTNDGGITWRTQLIENSNELFILYDICFPNKKYGWAVGHRYDTFEMGIILNSVDSGKTWQIQSSEVIPLNKVYFRNYLQGCAIGTNIFSSDVVLMTYDGGITWEDISLTASGLNNVAFSNDSIGWIVGDEGQIWKTLDSGGTWIETDSGTEENLEKIIFLEDGQVGYILGDNNTILKYDHGLSSTVNVNIFSHFQLLQNRPNPANPTTIIEYFLEVSSNIQINIFDINGKLIDNLVNGHVGEGHHEIKFDGSGLSSGVYFVTMRADNYSDCKKILLLK